MKASVTYHRVLYTSIITLIVTIGLSQTAIKTSVPIETVNADKVTVEANKVPEDSSEIHFVIYTSMGNMKGKLYNSTPIHRDNFLKLSKEKYFDSLLFHRVIKQFMIQGGDPNSRGAADTIKLGGGGPNYTLKAEINPELFHKKGVLSAARQEDNVNPTKRSSGSQFYLVQGKIYSEAMLTTQETRINQQKANQAIGAYLKKPENKIVFDEVMYCQQARLTDSLNKVVARIKPLVMEGVEEFHFTAEQKTAYSTIGGTPHLDGNYTVFGEVYEGLDVIDKIAASPTAPGYRPLTDVIMVITIIE
jgi:cyclophilin family peptidyl-prolyl cis-trans isomerase